MAPTLNPGGPYEASGQLEDKAEGFGVAPLHSGIQSRGPAWLGPLSHRQGYRRYPLGPLPRSRPLAAGRPRICQRALGTARTGGRTALPLRPACRPAAADGGGRGYVGTACGCRQPLPALRHAAVIQPWRSQPSRHAAHRRPQGAAGLGIPVPAVRRASRGACRRRRSAATQGSVMPAVAGTLPRRLRQPAYRRAGQCRRQGHDRIAAGRQSRCAGRTGACPVRPGASRRGTGQPVRGHGPLSRLGAAVQGLCRRGKWR